MKKLQLNALNIGGALSRVQMKKIAGGGFHPCASQCLSDGECASGHCVIAPDPNCHNRDGSIQNVGTCGA